MPRYIDAEKVIDTLDQSINIFDATDRIKVLKAADVVEVVRCEDCLYGKPLGVVGTWCNRNDGLYPNAGYCSYGERREDAEVH